MITAFFLIYFLDTNTFYVHSQQQVFKTEEECNQFALSEIERQKELSTNRAFTAIHYCHNWGQDA